MTFRPASEILEASIDKNADQLGLSRNQYLNKAIDLFDGLAPDTIERIEKASQKFGMSESEFVQAVILMWAAKMDASIEVWGSPDGDLLPIKGTTAETHYIYYKSTAVKNYEKEVIKTISLHEARNLPLSDAERRVAIKYRIGKAWLESEEYKREQEVKAEIERFKQMIKDEADPDEIVSPEELEEWTKDQRGD